MDTCQTCDSLKNLIDNKIVPELKRQFKLEKEVCLKKAKIFFYYLKSYVKNVKLNEEIELLSLDFQQNVP